ncbi:M12 family metallo-peptidase [Streptomyces sp. NPDC059002]|uniref:InlB B-repeat-containing protein n=1 Tax=Streptomyces sp. NPDC059002 TaxID=3346690 RepID=UPI0036865673
MRRLSLVSCALVTAVLVAVPLTAPSAASPPAASVVRASAAGPDPSRPWVLRQAVVPLSRDNFGPLCDPAPSGPPPEYPLALFPDDPPIQAVQEYRQQVGEDTVNWSGRVVGVPGHTVHITVTGACTGGPVTLIGTADLGRMQYTYAPAPGRPGHALVEEIDTWAMPKEPDDTLPAERARPAARAEATAARATADTPVIDVVVGYTTNAKTKAGGEDAMKARIAEAETGMNRALSDSGVPASVDVVHTYEITGYKEVTSTDDMLNKKLRKADDEDLGKKAHELRDEHAADLFSVIMDLPSGSDALGRADLPKEPTADTTDKAYSIVDVGVMASYYTFAHELGHNLALTHTQPEAKWTTHSQGSGWITPDGKYVTIMRSAYTCPSSCTRIGQYSNTLNTWQGQPLGDKETDAAEVLRANIPAVAAYRAPKKAYDRKALTLTAGPEEGGTVRPSIWGPYRDGKNTQITVTATPKEGYAFDGWKLDGHKHGNTEPSMALTMDKGHTLEATFKKAPAPVATHQVTASASPEGGGSVELSPAGGTYKAGDQVIARAKAAEGYDFVRWTLDGQQIGTNEEIAVAVSQNHRLVAEFAESKTELTTSVTPGDQAGTIRLSEPGPYIKGRPVVATAEAAQGYRFNGWTMDGQQAGTDNPLTVTMDKAHTLIAAFEPVKPAAAACPHPVTGAIAKVWKAQDAAKGRLKCPTGPEKKTPNGKGVQQVFEGGVVYWTKKHGAHPVWGAFLTQWKNLKYEAGRLGFPTSGEQPRPGGKKGVLQKFQGGTLTWDSKTKKITATYTK